MTTPIEPKPMKLTKSTVMKLLADLSGVTVTGKGADFEIETTEEQHDTVHARVSGLGGYKTGYGNWILRTDYKPMGDWNDPSSRWHY